MVSLVNFKSDTIGLVIMNGSWRCFNLASKFWSYEMFHGPLDEDETIILFKIIDQLQRYRPVEVSLFKHNVPQRR